MTTQRLLSFTVRVKYRPCLSKFSLGVNAERPRLRAGKASSSEVLYNGKGDAAAPMSAGRRRRRRRESDLIFHSRGCLTTAFARAREIARTDILASSNRASHCDTADTRITPFHATAAGEGGSISDTGAVE